MILLAAQTGLHASELIGLTYGDLRLGLGAPVSFLGKRREQRISPLTKQTKTVMRTWTRERAGRPDDPPLPPAPTATAAATRSSAA